FMIVEHFTGASCGPCANQNPGLEELLSHNTDKVVMLTHQTNIPSYDPMYEDYPEGPNSRRAYYGINSAPQTVLDGNAVGPISPMYFTQGSLDDRFAIDSPLNIELSYVKTATDIEVSMTITGLDDLSGDLVARIAVIENEITFDEAPGSNGEKVFDKVLKQFLPSPSGTDISDTWTVNQEETIVETWVFENVYDINEIAVIAYVQDNNTKEIIQGAFAKTEILYDLDAKLSKLHEIPEYINSCDPEVLTPRVVVTNYGSTPINSFDVECKINGGNTNIYNWTGALNHLDPAVIHFPELTYGVLEEENEISARIININGLPNDDNPSNDEAFEIFEASPTFSDNFQIRFCTGSLGAGFVWRIVSQGNTPVPDEYALYMGGYAGTDTITIDINLPQDCWRFIMKSGSTGDVNGFFFEIIDLGEVKYSIETIGYVLHIPFYVDPTVNIPEASIQTSPIYPNPSKGSVYINNTKKSDVYIYNMQGAMVMVKRNVQANGKLDLSSLSNGKYIIKMILDNDIITQSVILQ
ncbi:MAG: T9SS type A sorting domain-containing protein, partial [Chlamydiia bacterium]|nr:T9SS type A sorting domain-containing protein [Chlamydiia bacterium]